MITIPGTYATAKIYTDVIEPSAEGQIKALCDQPFAAGSKIRIMPDVHTGKGCPPAARVTSSKTELTFKTRKAHRPLSVCFFFVPASL